MRRSRAASPALALVRVLVLVTVVSVLAACAHQGETGPTPGVTPSASGSSGPSARPAPTTVPPGASVSASPSASSPSPSASSPSGSPRPQSLTVVMNGDLLWHNTLWFSAREDARRAGRTGMDFAPLLKGMKSVVAGADLAICHEEVPLAKAGGPYSNYPIFAAPPSVVRAIKATGYDACTTSSNHSMDQGFDGITRTLDDLDRAGIKHTGTYRSKAESRRPTLLTADGVKVGLVAATFSTNGLPLPPGKPWAVDTPLRATDLIARAKRVRAAGAQIVLVALHAGTEYSTTENAEQVRLAKALTASPDVDLVYMHHVHVVQPWAKVNGKWVVYGLGNTVAQHELSVPRGYEGVTARFTFTQRGARFVVTKAEYIPTYVSHWSPGSPVRLYHVTTALRTAKGALRARLLAALARTTEVVTRHHPPGLIRS